MNAKLVPIVIKQMAWRSLHENVSNLFRSGKVMELKCTRSDPFMNKMVVNFNVFGASMEHGIMR